MRSTKRSISYKLLLFVYSFTITEKIFTSVKSFFLNNPRCTMYSDVQEIPERPFRRLKRWWIDNEARCFGFGI